MTWKRAIIITSAWLGLGLGLARTTPVAHACSCLILDSWELELEIIEDISEAPITGDLAREQDYWPTWASFTGNALHLGNGDHIEVRKVP